MADGDEILSIEGGVSPDGVKGKVVVGSGAPGFFDRIFPGRMAKSRLTFEIIDHVAAAIRTGTASDADAEFAQHYLGNEAAKWLRAKAIEQRAYELHEARPQRELPAHEATKAEEPAKPSNDWANRFLEDASLVDDAVLQELYARVLAGEAHKPGSCSLRTLNTLRSLDRNTAQNFGVVLSVLVDFTWLPMDTTCLEPFGVRYGIVEDLSEAGLINTQGNVRRIPKDDFAFRYGDRVIRVQKGAGRDFFTIPLTKAGLELARVADVKANMAAFDPIVRSLAALLRQPALKMPPSFELDTSMPVVSWAQLPHIDWNGDADALEWHAV